MNVFVLNTKEDIFKIFCNQAVLGAPLTSIVGKTNTIEVNGAPKTAWFSACFSKEKRAVFII